MQQPQLNGNKLVIELPEKISKMQRHNLLSLYEKGSLDDLLRYIKSFEGTRCRYLHLNKYRKYTDKSESNRFVKLYKELLDGKASPYTDSTNWVGVEIECFVPANGDYDGDDIVAELIKSRKIKCARAKHDASIRAIDGYKAVEVTVLTAYPDLENLRQVCKLLGDLGAKVNKSCGLHIHLDSRHVRHNDSALKKISNNFKRALPVLLQCVPESRRDNNYCRPKVGRQQDSRYCAVNFAALSKYNTIEIRLHSSTTDFNKIARWIELCRAIYNAENISNNITDLNTLESDIKISADCLEYFTNRIELFKPVSDNMISTSSDSLDCDNTDNFPLETAAGN